MKKANNSIEILEQCKVDVRFFSRKVYARTPHDIKLTDAGQCHDLAIKIIRQYYVE